MSTKVQLNLAPELNKSLTYSVMLAWRGDATDVVMFMDERNGIRLAGSKGAIGMHYSNLRATHVCWQPLPKGTTVTFTQE